MTKQNPIIVTCAIIEHEGCILAARRKPGISNEGRWEFPGGKLEIGETLEQCLKREIWEELSIEIIIQDKLPAISHTYPDKIIELHPFVCSYDGSQIMTGDVHQQILWQLPKQLHLLQWSDADIGVWQYYLKKYLPDI